MFPALNLTLFTLFGCAAVIPIIAALRCFPLPVLVPIQEQLMFSQLQAIVTDLAASFGFLIGFRQKFWRIVGNVGDVYFTAHWFIVCLRRCARTTVHVSCRYAISWSFSSLKYCLYPDRVRSRTVRDLPQAIRLTSCRVVYISLCVSECSKTLHACKFSNSIIYMPLLLLPVFVAYGRFLLSIQSHCAMAYMAYRSTQAFCKPACEEAPSVFKKTLPKDDTSWYSSNSVGSTKVPEPNLHCRWGYSSELRMILMN